MLYRGIEYSVVQGIVRHHWKWAATVSGTKISGYGSSVFMETAWLPSMDSRSVDAMIHAMAGAVSPGCAIITHAFRGAASLVPVEATAFGLRRDHVLVEIMATFADRSDPLEEQRHRQWAQGARGAFDAMALPGGYPNFLARGDGDRAAKAYGRNAERLTKAKRLTARYQRCSTKRPLGHGRRVGPS